MSKSNWSRVAQRSRLFYRIVNKLSNIVSLHLFKEKRYLKQCSKVVTFTFDDFPKTAVENGAEILESYGKKGTFYASLSLCSRNTGHYKIADIKDIENLNRKGHEIGCHTFSHLDCLVNSHENILKDCRNNKSIADNELGIKLFSFSYPYGNITPFIKKIIAKEYDTKRTIASGINFNPIDISALKSIPLYQKYGFETCLEWLKILEKKDGWLIFYTHDVTEKSSQFGCSKELLEKVINKCVEQNFKILTVHETFKNFLMAK